MLRIKNKKKLLIELKKNLIIKLLSDLLFLDEDTSNSSNAGKYTSFININVKDEKNIINKIDEVLKSKNKIHKKDIFFVQSMVKNIKISGVI